MSKPRKTPPETLTRIAGRSVRDLAKTLHPGNCILLCQTRPGSTATFIHPDGVIFSDADGILRLNGQKQITPAELNIARKVPVKKVCVCPRATGNLLNSEYLIPFAYSMMLAHPYGAVFYRSEEDDYVLVLT